MRLREINWRIWAGSVISAVLLYLAVRKIDFSEFSDAINQADYFLVIPAVLLHFIHLWLRSLRWKTLMAPMKKISVASLFSAMMIGTLVNNIFPARFGEIARAYVLGRKENVRKSSCLATVVIERLFDGLAVFIILACVLIFFNPPLPEWLRKSALVILILSVSVTGLLMLARLRLRKITEFARRVLTPLPAKASEKIVLFLENFLHGLEVLKDHKQLIGLLLFSVLLWIPPAFTIYAILSAFGIQLPLFASFMLLAIFCFGVAVPAAPGFIGVIQFMSVIGLAIFGVERTAAISFSVVYHVANYVPATLVGFIYYFSEGITFGQIKTAGEPDQGV
jgi:uncharacterized protein (TIRG00374 family)